MVEESLLNEVIDTIFFVKLSTNETVMIIGYPNYAQWSRLYSYKNNTFTQISYDFIGTIIDIDINNSALKVIHLVNVLGEWDMYRYYSFDSNFDFVPRDNYYNIVKSNSPEANMISFPSQNDSNPLITVKVLPLTYDEKVIILPAGSRIYLQEYNEKDSYVNVLLEDGRKCKLSLGRE